MPPDLIDIPRQEVVQGRRRLAAQESRVEDLFRLGCLSLLPIAERLLRHTGQQQQAREEHLQALLAAVSRGRWLVQEDDGHARDASEPSRGPEQPYPPKRDRTGSERPAKVVQFPRPAFRTVALVFMVALSGFVEGSGQAQTAYGTVASATSRRPIATSLVTTSRPPASSRRPRPTPRSCAPARWTRRACRLTFTASQRTRWQA
jgi:hypothetical protein